MKIKLSGLFFIFFSVFSPSIFAEDIDLFSSTKMNSRRLFGKDISAVLMGKDQYKQYLNSPAYTHVQNMRHRNEMGIPYVPFMTIEDYLSTSDLTRTKVRKKYGKSMFLHVSCFF